MTAVDTNGNLQLGEEGRSDTNPGLIERYQNNHNHRRHVQQSIAGDDISIVWLMSFPNSGTSYTSRLVREASLSMTATNYADEINDDKSLHHLVFPNQTVGPFWVPQDGFGPPASRFVLVKTHCGMRCAECSYVEYAESTYSFRRKCTLTKWRRRGKANEFQYGSYPTKRVRKAIHLVRDPFDNVISRFHLLMKKTRKYPTTRQGFLEHCLVQDQKFTDSEIRYAHFKENPILRDLWMVPCHAEFCKYVEWHNLALFVAQDLQLSTLIVHYETYSIVGGITGQAVLDFLELDKQAEFPAFDSKTYKDYYTMDERHIVRRALKFMASRETWDLLERYMPPQQ